VIQLGNYPEFFSDNSCNIYIKKQGYANYIFIYKFSKLMDSKFSLDLVLALCL